MVLDDHLADARQRREGGRRDLAREAQLDLVVGQVAQVLDGADLDQETLADDPHPVGGLLHLGEDVGGEEDRRPVGHRLAEDAEERLLDERVQARRRLVEQEQLGAVLEGDDEGDLLLVALAVLLELARRVEVEALDEAGLVGGVDAAAQVGEVLQVLAARQAVVEGELAGQVADPPVDRHRVGARRDAEHPGRPRGRPDQVEEGPDRRRLAGAVRPQEPEDLPLGNGEIDLDDPAVAAVALGELLGLDDVSGHRRPSIRGRGPGRTSHLTGGSGTALASISAGRVQ